MKEQTIVLPELTVLGTAQRDAAARAVLEQFDEWLQSAGGYALGYAWSWSSVVFGPNIPKPAYTEPKLGFRPLAAYDVEKGND